MSLATRCTHCGTIFKIVQDQLKVSEGWVRCGRCHEVFNALPALFDLDTEAPPPRQVPQAPQTPAQAPARQPMPSPSPVAPSPPASWSRTQPSGLDTPPAAVRAPTPPAPVPISAHTPLTSADLAFGSPASSATGARPAATDFDLDTSVDLSDPTPPWSPPAREPQSTQAPTAPTPTPVATARQPAQAAQRPLQQPVQQPQPPARAPVSPPPAAAAPRPAPAADPMAGGLHIASEPRPWLDEPPEDVPSTDEADALESRYLLPSDTRQVRRRERGPEFADAQFPTDLDAEDEWARYQDSVPAPLTEPPPMSSLPATSPAQEPAHGDGDVPPDAAKAGAADAGAGTSADPEASTTLLRHPDPGYVPEQAVQPPSQRKGRSGTRGRDPASQAPEFVRRAQRKAFWRLPVVQVAMGLIALLLTLGLTVQLGHHFRDWVAAHHPSTRPLLNAWCAQVGCQIKPPMRLDALQVDAATLVRTASEGADRYRLTVAVNSRSDVELAWPHIDLTLTDDRGTVIARRAFAPSDAQVAKGEGMPLLSVPQAVPAGESTQLQWLLRLDDLAPAGYTAELFYP